MPNINDNDFSAPEAEIVAGSNLRIQGGYAPDADLFLQREASYNPSARSVASRFGRVYESGSAGRDYIESGSAGRDYIGAILGDGSTYTNAAPDQMWGLLESVVNAGLNQTNMALAAYDRIAFAPDADAIADEYTAADGVSDENATTETQPAVIPPASLSGLLKVGSAILIVSGIYKLWNS